jgi:hypothetical protein
VLGVLALDARARLGAPWLLVARIGLTDLVFVARVICTRIGTADAVETQLVGTTPEEVAVLFAAGLRCPARGNTGLSLVAHDPEARAVTGFVLADAHRNRIVILRGIGRCALDVALLVLHGAGRAIAAGVFRDAEAAAVPVEAAFGPNALHPSRTREFTTRARARAQTAVVETDAALPGRTQRWRLLVDVAVAVIVDTVALLGLGTQTALAGDHALDTRQGAVLTDALLVATFIAQVPRRIVRIRGAIDSIRGGAGLIDVAVAVVVDAVANFRFRPTAAVAY